jgi:hypothetical protein
MQKEFCFEGISIDGFVKNQNLTQSRKARKVNLLMNDLSTGGGELDPTDFASFFKQLE